MAQYFDVHPDNPQTRLLKQAVELIHKGGVVAVPTDSCYALVCHLDDKDAVTQLRRLRGVDERHHLSLLCRDMSELANHARLNNAQFRWVKQHTPGPFTFLLEATKEVPRRVCHPQRKSIGLRMPDHRTVQALLEAHGEALIASTFIPAGEDDPLNDAEAIRERYEHQLAAVLEAGPCPNEPTTVVDLTPMATGGDYLLIRQGRGQIG
jgi:tRNA threonylcarbamoyl adenosine modification protein (Sua5/YciO/YrdC/YwlC family)